MASLPCPRRLLRALRTRDNQTHPPTDPHIYTARSHSQFCMSPQKVIVQLTPWCVASHGYRQALNSGRTPSMALRGVGNVMAPCPTTDAMALQTVNTMKKRPDVRGDMSTRNDMVSQENLNDSGRNGTASEIIAESTTHSWSSRHTHAPEASTATHVQNVGASACA